MRSSWTRFGDDPFREATNAGLLPGDSVSIDSRRLIPGIGPMAQECEAELLRYAPRAFVVKDKAGERKIVEWSRAIAWMKKAKS